MNTQQAYINGFVKRANEYGYSDNQAIELLKHAGLMDTMAAKLAPISDKLKDFMTPRTTIENFSSLQPDSTYQFYKGDKRLPNPLPPGMSANENLGIKPTMTGNTFPQPGQLISPDNSTYKFRKPADAWMEMNNGVMRQGTKNTPGAPGV